MIQVDIDNYDNQTNIRRGYDNEKRLRSQVKSIPNLESKQGQIQYTITSKSDAKMSLRNYNWLGLRWFFVNCLKKPTPNQIIEGIMDEL